MKIYPVKFVQRSAKCISQGPDPTVLHIGDPFRFENRKQLIKMSGYDLCANRSGRTSDKAIPGISKKGNDELRYAWYQAVRVASARVDLFRTYSCKQYLGRPLPAVFWRDIRIIGCPALPS